MSVDINTGLIAIIIAMLLVGRWKEQDVLEQIRAERNEVRRDEQSRCKSQITNSFALYSQAIREGFRVADESNNQDHRKHPEVKDGNETIN